jgi:hypothetical protein
VTTLNVEFWIKNGRKVNFYFSTACNLGLLYS